jgi:hypothetical protein
MGEIFFQVQNFDGHIKIVEQIRKGTVDNLPR